MAPRMKAIVILNDQAGTARQSGLADTDLRAAFAQAGIDAEVHTLAPANISEALRVAVTARPDVIIVGGGDGTVRSAAAALADTGLTLGVLPLGTLNHFAKDLKMPGELAAAIDALARGQVREIDIAEVNGHVFINNCSLGTYAEAVRRREFLRDQHGKRKWWAMVLASFTAFRRFRRLRLRMTVDGGAARTVRTPLLVVGNNRYSGHVLHTTLRARLDEGRLWLYTAHVHRHLAALRLALQSLIRRLDAADALASEPARALTITSESGPLPVAADGEIVELTGPLHFRIRPLALRVLVPPENPPPTSALEKIAQP